MLVYCYREVNDGPILKAPRSIVEGLKDGGWDIQEINWWLTIWDLVTGYENEERVKDDTKGFILNHLMIVSATNIKEVWWMQCAKNKGRIRME